MKVSILMTVYNDGGRLLNKSIESVLNQTYKNIEFVIVDDGSKDNSKDIIKKYAKNDSRVIFIPRNENKGRVYSLNEGLEACTGKLVFINDADDISKLDRIEKCIEFYLNEVKNKDRFGILGTGYVINDISYGKKKSYKIKYGTLLKKKISLWRILVGMPFPHSSFMYSREALNDIGGFPKEVTSSIDYFALLKIATKYNIFAINKILIERTIDKKNYFMTQKMTEENELNKIIVKEWAKKNIRFYSIAVIPSKIRNIITNS